ncbi:exo-beta-N-acetylmuramidase NamZ domain-containing protein, partial [Clostridium sp. D53t1_180928_C8]|uniref:exo-beta-N-acetylmuramidase NamZ domain-containing protein n=1 Tax=Clostridium sp. D53t1_180928_C8 TaxID=2787101 RepID=UPI001FAD1C34
MRKRVKNIIVFVIALFIVNIFSNVSVKAIIKDNKVKLGIDNIDNYLDIFKDKKVGLITNPSGMDSDFTSSIDVLYERTELTTLFAAEHGIR